MPELFLELFSEEIPARMQAGAAADLARLLGAALAPLSPAGVRTFHGPRRIAFRAEVAAEVAAASSIERGPRVSAPEQALAGFLRKHGAAREQLREDDGYWVLEKRAAAVAAATLIAGALPPLLRRFPWPKSMRWGGTSGFTWVRPLRRIVCLLDGAVVPFDLHDGADDGHGLAASNLTEGHRFHAPHAFAVTSAAGWADGLARHRVLVAAGERRQRIAQGIASEAAARGLTVVDDPGLLDEVAGLVEWPVPLLGRIDPAFMDLPGEVMQVSMRVNQRYFALRDAAGRAAPWFGFVANIEAEDGGAAIVAGNERVLRARFADARHFWDLDRRTRLADRVPALDAITFHAKLGSQGARVRRLRRLAGEIAVHVGADPALADRAATLVKADLVTGMVGEFPELQGVMGSYYARHDHEPAPVAEAVREHYAPKGPNDTPPAVPVSVAVALADKLDQLAGFFAVGEKPTGSGDPYALRRAALGIIRIIREGGLRLRLTGLIDAAGAGFAADGISPRPADELLEFIVERLRVQLRGEGARHDVLDAVFAIGRDDDLTRLLARARAVADLLGTEDGANLLAAYRRADSIVQIEAQRDGHEYATVDPDRLDAEEERAVFAANRALSARTRAALAEEGFAAAAAGMAQLRAPLDAFFDRVTVNADRPDLRRNRLALLREVREHLRQLADFSKIQG
ncbi:MAG: glycine--tRNA ligase subunit beta [Rhodospirillales bacterium]|nr:glycine--tRNA ligase subunit beta [Rhodospirillales bacterium]